MMNLNCGATYIIFVKVFSLLHHTSLCIKHTASDMSELANKAEEHQVSSKMDASKSKLESRPKTRSEDRKSNIRKKTSGLSRLLSAISITLLAFVILLQPSTVNLDTSLSHDGESKTALILTAHPDDEVMFFTPTILALLAAGWEVGGLCLSNGQFSIMSEEES
jgi:hypothetical protein